MLIEIICACVRAGWVCARYKRLRLYCALKKIINPLLITPIFLSIKYTYKYTQAYMRAYIIDQISSYLQKKKKCNQMYMFVASLSSKKDALLLGDYVLIFKCKA